MSSSSGLCTRFSVVLALVASLSIGSAQQTDALQALDGVWVYVEDRTEGRSLEQLGPPMSSTFSFRVEEGAVILASGHGSGHKDVRVALDGTVNEFTEGNTTYRYSGAWKDSAFSYKTEIKQETSTSVYEKEFRVDEEGLLVRVVTRFGESVGLYKHPEDIPMPTPAKATINDLAWFSGAWVGTRGTGGAISFEERWNPPLGGAMLAVSRTVSRGRMSAFEFLRIVEKDGGLVYIAQPNGGTPTEFVLTEFSATRAVFDNPRHDYPKRIVYELKPDGLTATIGFMKGGTPRRFEFKREGAGAKG
jgi:hypothetical protein